MPRPTHPYMKGPVLGLFFFLYMIIDLFSRKIVGWEVWEKESGDYAATLLDRAVLAEQCRTILRVLHGDNGAIQKSSTLLAKIDALGVLPSFNRPGVSNDNSYSESLFRTCKYRPDFPRVALPRSRRRVSGFKPLCIGTTMSIGTVRFGLSLLQLGMRVLMA